MINSSATKSKIVINKDLVRESSKEAWVTLNGRERAANEQTQNNIGMFPARKEYL